MILLDFIRSSRGFRHSPFSSRACVVDDANAIVFPDLEVDVLALVRYLGCSLMSSIKRIFLSQRIICAFPSSSRKDLILLFIKALRVSFVELTDSEVQSFPQQYRSHFQIPFLVCDWKQLKGLHIVISKVFCVPQNCLVLVRITENQFVLIRHQTFNVFHLNARSSLRKVLHTPINTRGTNIAQTRVQYEYSSCVQITSRARICRQIKRRDRTC